MIVYYKSDFDFRLDLQGLNPLGDSSTLDLSALDFSGKLFSGRPDRHKNFYSFSRQGQSLVNCLFEENTLRVTVANHRLRPGPLFCELSITMPDASFPSGSRSAVHAFPLGISLSETGSELVTPTVSLNLPVIQLPGASSDDDPVTSVSQSSRFAKPWLSPRVCGGRFSSGAFAGNVYRNCGRMYLAGFTVKGDEFSTLHVYLPKLCSLTGLSPEQLPDRVLAANPDHDFECEIRDNHLLITYPDFSPGFYVDTKSSSPYVTITPEDTLLFFQERPIEDYAPPKLTFEEISYYFEKVGTKPWSYYVRSTKHFKLQFWGKYPSQRKWSKHTNHIYFRRPRYEFNVWRTKKHGIVRAFRPLHFRAARRTNGKLSDWQYFTLKFDYIRKKYCFIKTDEANCTVADRWFL